ncbi:MAG: urea ABC transporter permease subunit UrtB [Limnobacter sp.]|nr:urea ABC transporter permease subunit UrtB [Limnobacter sp.]
MKFHDHLFQETTVIAPRFLLFSVFAVLLSLTLLDPLCLYSGGAAFAQSNTEAADDTPDEPAPVDYSTLTVPELLKALTTTPMAELEGLLIALESKSTGPVLNLFKTLQDGNLYFNEQDAALVAQVEKDGRTTLSNALTGELIPENSSQAQSMSLTKIRVNNALRTYLKGAVSRLQINDPQASIREQAVLGLLAELDEPTIAAIQKVRLTEKNERVQKAMDTALAMYTLSNAKDPLERAKAVTQLAGSQQAAVRNMLDELILSETEPVVLKAAFEAQQGMQMRTKLYAFLDQLFFGLSLGSVLLLAAIGLAITFGVMGVINMAHGEMMMLGAYTTYVVQLMMPTAIDYSLWVAIPLAFVVAASVGVLIERCVIRFLHGRPLETLLATFGISLILQQLVRTIFSPLNRQVSQPGWMSGSVEINPELSITLNRLYIFIFALIVFAILQIILKKTSLGLNVRAVSQNRNMAKSMGVRTDWVDAMTFGLGSGIAGIAGVALSQLTNVGPNLGQNYIIDSFMVVVFGGVGNLLGTLVAAFSLGVANKFLEPMTGAVLASIIILVFIILFIQKRPKGLFPQKGRAAE